MKYDKVIIKQIPDDSSVASGLSKYNRSKMPGTTEYLQVSVNIDGRYITGIDEHALSIKKITDKEERDARIAEVKELRESLERQTQKDLSGTSDFWETFAIPISADDSLTLNRTNPMDVIKYHALIANRYAAPDKQSGALPQFLQAKYYCFIEENVNTIEVTTHKLKDKARGQLLELSENEDHAVLIGQYLEGDKYKKGVRGSTIYKMLSDFIDNTKEPDNVKKFTKAVSLPIEDLLFKVTVDKAIKKRIIKLKEGYFQRGQVTLGKNTAEVYDNLKKPDFATEFISIKEELEEA